MKKGDLFLTKKKFTASYIQNGWPISADIEKGCVVIILEKKLYNPDVVNDCFFVEFYYSGIVFYVTCNKVFLSKILTKL